ncbi:MAG: hypothetical protein ACFCD0_24255 [Gemmataceae bacterium]
MSLWSWFTAKEAEYQIYGDDERLKMAECFEEAFDVAERNPDLACQLHRKGQRLAEQLDEPWWAYLYEVWYVLTVVSHKRDFRNLLDDAMACYLKGNRPELAGHPWYLAIVNKLSSIYIAIDVEGYREELTSAFAHADSVIPPGPGEHRSVFLSGKTTFLRMTGRLEEAWQTALEHLELIESAKRIDSWYLTNVRASLACVSFYRRDWESLEYYATEVEELARRATNRLSDLGEALLWQAVIAQRDGHSDHAHRLYNRGRNVLRSLGELPSDEYFDTLAYFHELANDYEHAVWARDHALQTIQNRGMLGTEARWHVDRCRLRRLADELTQQDMAQAREAANKLRKPQPSLDRLQRIEDGNTE